MHDKSEIANSRELTTIMIRGQIVRIITSSIDNNNNHHQSFIVLEQQDNRTAN